MCQSVQETVTELEEDYMIDTVITDNNNPWNVKLNIKGTDVVFKIDTGADVSIMNEEMYEKMKTKPQLRHTRIGLMSAAGKLPTRGEFVANTVYKSKSFKFRVVVAKNRVGSNLLSRNVAEQMGMVKRIEEMNGVFGHTGLLKTEPVTIKLKDGATPYCVTTARRVPFAIQDKVKKELNRMKADGIIREVTNPTDWCAPMVPVVKPNGSIRVCVDFKKLNQEVKRPYCMLPNLEDIAPKMAGSRVFSTLDAASGFFQIPIQEESMPLTTFITPFGRYCFQRVPMGISLGPECFQTKMKETLEGLDGCEAIMDDTIVYGRTEEEHDQRLKAVLKRLEESGLKLNKEKCFFKKSEVKFFGHIISAEGVRPDPEKVRAITEMPAPTSVSELRTVLGMFNYLSRYVPGMATTMKPITDLLKKNVAWTWETTQEEAFKAVKRQLSASPALEFYKPDRKTVVSADSSSYGLGAALMQWKGDTLVPIAYASRTLTDAERHYAQIEKECLASTWACEKFSKYLIGLDSFQLQTDHKPLVPLMRNKDLDKAPVRCQRLLIRLMRFNMDVVHVPGKQIVIADALSRSPVPHTEDDEKKVEAVTAHAKAVKSSVSITPQKLELFRAATVHDPELQQVMDYMLNGWPGKVDKQFQPYQQSQGELSLVDGLVIFNKRVVVPTALRQEILHKLHETHQGLAKCRLNAQATVWWPGLSKQLTDLINGCRVCQEQRPAQRHEPLRPTELPQRPWQQLGVDLCSHEGKDYLVAVDYYTRWIEVRYLGSTTATAVINKLRMIFATHGIPEAIVSDNGPQFQCREFQTFAQEYDFLHRTSSPGFPQANGEAESAVKIAKKILRQTDPDLALLNYRATPHSSTGISPAQALMGRQLRTKLPRLAERLIPQPVNDADLRAADQKTKEAYKCSYDRRHGVLPLSRLSPGDRVLMKTDAESRWRKEGTVVAADPDNRTYLVNSSAGVQRRNRRHLQLQPTVSPRRVAAQGPEAVSGTSADSGDSVKITLTHTQPHTVPKSPRRVTRSSHGFVAPKPVRFRGEEKV